MRTVGGKKQGIFFFRSETPGLGRNKKKALKGDSYKQWMVLLNDKSPCSTVRSDEAELRLRTTSCSECTWYLIQRKQRDSTIP